MRQAGRTAGEKEAGNRMIMGNILGWIAFGLSALAILVSPWFFAAWEMWWFWPFAVCIFAASGALALRLVLGGDAGGPRIVPRREVAAAVAAFSLFLLYAFMRFIGAGVRMDAERSFLLFLTPFLLALAIVFGFDAGQRRLLAGLMAANFLALGGYGIVNHFVTGGERVLWAYGYPQYIREGRATGTYFCPDHFAGLMELGLCAALGLLLARDSRWQSRLFSAALAAVAVWGVVLSKSRGGGMTVAVVLLLGLAWGFDQWQPATRRALRIGALLLIAAAALVLAVHGRDYVERFRQYPWNQIRASDRYQMITAGLRAWRSSPIVGIGPGMHQHLWPHFAASPDGDRERGKWPSFPNNTFHSYETHSDWTQLLEEYGVVGLALFLGAAGVILHGLHRGRRRMLRRCGERGEPAPDYWTVLAGLLACGAMAFHSLGDFNLQMPATVWIFAAMVAVPLGHVWQER